MSKKIFVIFLFMLLVLSGCGLNNEVKVNDDAIERRPDLMKERFADWQKADSDQIVNGLEVTVMGVKNSDNTMNANTIIIGKIGEMTGTNQREFNSENKEIVKNENSENLRQMPGNRRMEMTPEMREEFEKRRSENPEQINDGNNRRQMTGGASNGDVILFGEIISLDETSFILKLVDGGSQLVFYSPRTEIFFSPKNEKEVID